MLKSACTLIYGSAVVCIAVFSLLFKKLKLVIPGEPRVSAVREGDPGG
jgi:hypothetical protein